MPDLDKSASFPLDLTHHLAMPDPRISDKELAAINAAAVTKEYRVQPHLGKNQGALLRA
jgi:hypothetical protein